LPDIAYALKVIDRRFRVSGWFIGGFGIKFNFKRLETFFKPVFQIAHLQVVVNVNQHI
jgi:hypothetical protein